MVQLEPLGRGVEVNGQTVLSFVDGVPQSFADNAQEILADNGIEEPEPDEWYPQQAWLDAFEEVANSVGTSTLNNIGQSIPEHAEWPPGVDGVVEAIESIDLAYHQNHRGGDIGHYEAKQVDDSTVRVECTNPYPCDFDQGIIKAVGREFSDEFVRVEEIGNTCRNDGDEKCSYEVSW
jgi:hypothetical protein